MKVIYQNTDVFPDQDGSLLYSCFSSFLLPSPCGTWHSELPGVVSVLLRALDQLTAVGGAGSHVPPGPPPLRAGEEEPLVPGVNQALADTGHITPLSPSSFLPGLPTLAPGPPPLWVSSCFSGHFFIFFIVVAAAFIHFWYCWCSL